MDLPSDAELVASVERPSPGALQTLRVLVEEDHTRAQVVEMVKRDASTVGALMRAVSMADSAPSQRVRSVDSAVAMLGEDAVRRILIHRSLAAMRVEQLGGYGVEDFAFWRNSVAVAHAAEGLANRLGLHGPSMYLAGLLLDVGKLALDAKLSQSDWDDDMSPDALERRACGFDHASIGASIAVQWHLWEPIPTCIRFHHRPTDARSHSREVAVVHVASWMASWLGPPTGLDALRHPLDEAAVARLNVDMSSIEGMAVAVLEGLQAAA